MGAGNFGNEGSLDAMISALRRCVPNVRMSCAVASPEPVSERTGLPALSFNKPDDPRPWVRLVNRLLLGLPRALGNIHYTLRALRGKVAIVVPGTGILDDYGTGPRGMPSTLFRWTLLARLSGVRVLLVSIGAGPILDYRTRALMWATAKLATFRSFRDEGSKAFVTSLGVDTSLDMVTPDIVFSLPAPALSPMPRRGEPLTVGVGVMKYRGWRSDTDRSRTIQETYLKSITNLCRRLLELGYRVRILTGAESDWEAVESIRRAVELAGPGRDRLEANRTHDLSGVMAEAARCDVVIASRFHNVVCTLLAGRPVISLGYADKNDQLLHEVGLDDCCQHIERIDLTLLERQLQSLVAQRAPAAEMIQKALERYRACLSAQEAWLAGLLTTPAGAHEVPGGVVGDRGADGRSIAAGTQR
jgi:polysaccharide pyruvyl transferase WcaK-like protein